MQLFFCDKITVLSWVVRDSVKRFTQKQKKCLKRCCLVHGLYTQGKAYCNRTCPYTKLLIGLLNNYKIRWHSESEGLWPLMMSVLVIDHQN